MYFSESVAIALIIGVVCCYALRYARRFSVRVKPQNGEIEIRCAEKPREGRDCSEAEK